MKKYITPEYNYRKIVEKHLGRKLRSDEVVHHINENRNDNRIENLIVMGRKEHHQFHATMSQLKNETAPYFLLKKRIVELKLYRTELAKMLNMKPGTLSCKLGGEIGFSEKEVQNLIKVLDIKEEEIEKMFKDNKPVKSRKVKTV